MSKYSLDNLMMPMSHFNSYLARGGGGGGDQPVAAPAPTFTSNYPELSGKIFSTEKAKQQAEAAVDQSKASATSVAGNVQNVMSQGAEGVSNYQNQAISLQSQIQQLKQAKDAAMAAAPEGQKDMIKEQYDSQIKGLQTQMQTAKSNLEVASATRQAGMAQDASNMQAQALTDPTKLATKADVATIDPNAAGTTIAEGTGQLITPAPQITMPSFGTSATAGGSLSYEDALYRQRQRDVKSPEEQARIDAALALGPGGVYTWNAPENQSGSQAAKVDPTKIAQDVEAATSQVSAVQGAVSPDAQITAAQGDPTQMAGTQLNVEQIAQAQQVAPTPPRVIQPGEMISGSAVDMAAVDAATQVQAAQANPSAAATVQGQMADLMADFEGSEPPAWAAGALRNATAQMAARGLGASSMAGQALVQAAMESALPIAMQDAQTNVQFEMANLSNRQQTAMFAAQQRAQFLELDFNQQFQTRVANAARIADVANMNFTAEQQIALENARMAQTVDITNLNAANAKIMADAAAMSQMDMANLNNRQQAAVANAQAFLAMDMKNMDFQQSTNMFKAQQNIQALFSDQAADNAAKQFNAASENQTNQFFANMATQVQQFNAGMTVQREQFNAQNALVVAQANAQWRQNVETINTAAQNEANRNEAMAANQFTQSTLDQVWQRERDIMDYAFRQSESAYDRALSVFLSDKADSLEKWKTAQANKQSDKEGMGYIFSRLLFQ